MFRLLTLFSCLTCCFGLPIDSPADGRPNILFVAVDDLRPELGCYGAGTLTPHFDALASSGIRFDRAYCQQAVCGASRLSLMGGRYPTSLGEHTYHVEGWRKRHPDLLTLQQHFGQSGYRTVGLGKIYHGARGPGVDPENWDEWIVVNGASYALEESLRVLREQPRPRAGSRAKGPSTERADVDDDAYTDGARAVEGAKQLKKLAAAGKPFFLAVGFTKPHLPFNAPARYWDLYDRSQFAMPPNRGVPPGYPDFARNASAGELRSYADIERRVPAEFPDPLNRRLLHGYAACVSYTDANLGRLLEALDESGAAENTIVVLWGDHGWKLGDHSSWCKHTNFEVDTRVPLLMRVPGKAAGHESEALVELVDLYPTLCELAGLPIPGHVQGRSFASLFDDPKASHRESAYSMYPHGKFAGHSIRTSTHRYTEWFRREDGKRVAPVLTDLVADPGETSNVLDDPGHSAAREHAARKLAKRVAEALAP